MSFLFSWIPEWFWKNRKIHEPSPDEAIYRLNETMSLLEKKQAYLEEKILKETQQAKALASTNKRAAIQCLARKKKLEEQLKQIDGTIITMETQKDSLDNASSNIEVMKSLEFASISLKSVHADLNVDKVHEVMDVIQEQQELSSEISNVISSPLNGSTIYDDADLLEELKELEYMDDDELLVRLPNAPNIEPSPIRKKTSKEDDLEKELAALTAA